MPLRFARARFLAAARPPTTDSRFDNCALRNPLPPPPSPSRANARQGPLFRGKFADDSGKLSRRRSGGGRKGAGKGGGGSSRGVHLCHRYRRYSLQPRAVGRASSEKVPGKSEKETNNGTFGFRTWNSQACIILKKSCSSLKRVIK